MGEVVHCLVNMPPEIIEKEIRMRKQRYFLVGKSDEETAAGIELLNNSMIFDDIPIKKRVFRVKVYRDPSKMVEVYDKIEIAREWLKKFHRKHIFAKFE